MKRILPVLCTFLCLMFFFAPAVHAQGYNDDYYDDDDYYSDDDYYYVDVSYPIYSTYTNTIEYLQSIGLYNDSARDVDNIKSITVENYYPGHDLEVEDESTLEYGNSKSVEYTDMELGVDQAFH